MENLKPAIGSVKKRKRIGRGPGSGMGKTSTRGHKGQKARKGGFIRIGFEGGQTPLYRRLPKRGFKNARFKKIFSEINVYVLNNFNDGSVVRVDDYIKAGIIKSNKIKVKILGNGELKKKLEVHADKFTKSAKDKIEKAGGKIITIEKQNTEVSVKTNKEGDNKEEKEGKEVKNKNKESK